MKLSYIKDHKEMVNLNIDQWKSILPVKPRKKLKEIESQGSVGQYWKI